jgi:hypothetical protein
MMWLYRGIGAITLAILLGAHPARAVQDLPPGGEPRVEMFLQAFLQMALWPSDTFNTFQEPRPAIAKLGQTVKVRLSASGYEDFIRKLLRDEAATAHIDIAFLDRQDKSEDIFIEMAHYTDALSPLSKVCNTVIDVGEQGQRRMHVHADPLGVVMNLRNIGPGDGAGALDTAGFFGCFNRETLRALGLGNDHDHPTVMSAAYSHWDLTPIDRMSVGTLYDPRVKPGAHWLGAMAAAREAVVERMIAEGAPPDTAAMGRKWIADFARYMTAQAEDGQNFYQPFFQVQLGFAYTYGEATEYLPHDPAVGYQWFRRAAEAGDAEAQAQVADALLNGRGVAANRREGIRWLQRAADAGHVEAQRKLDEIGDTRLRLIEPPTVEPPPVVFGAPDGK